MKKNKLQIGKDLEVERFIYGITRQIWESEQINSIYDYYNEDVIVRSPRSTTFKCNSKILVKEIVPVCLHITILAQ